MKGKTMGAFEEDTLLMNFCWLPYIVATDHIRVFSRKVVLVQTRFFRSNLGRLEQLMEAEQVVVNITVRFSCHRMSGGIASLSEDV